MLLSTRLSDYKILQTRDMADTKDNIAYKQNAKWHVQICKVQ